MPIPICPKPKQYSNHKARKNTFKLLSATKPTEKRVRKSSDSGFKTAPDGRLIITESSDEDEGQGSDDEDIDDLLDALEKGRDTGKVSIFLKLKTV